MLLGPSQYIVEIAALVDSVEDGKDVHVLSFTLDPTLSKHTNITRALELLPDDIETVVYTLVSATLDHASGINSTGVTVNCTHQHEAGLSVQSSRRHQLLDHGNSRHSREASGVSCSEEGFSTLKKVVQTEAKRKTNLTRQ